MMRITTGSQNYVQVQDRPTGSIRVASLMFAYLEFFFTFLFISVVEEFHGEMPRTSTALIKELPGVGRYFSDDQVPKRGH